MSELKVSVVMATYNGEEYLSHQLHSTVEQSKIPDEVLVLDDGSRDSTETVAKKYVRNYPFVHFYKNDRNLGYVMNFWNGIHKASGDIIFLSDQDDVWHKDKIEAEMHLFETHPDMLCLNTAYQLIDGEGKKFMD